MVGDGIDKIYKEVDNPIVNYIVTKVENINQLEMMEVLYQLNMEIIF